MRAGLSMRLHNSVGTAGSLKALGKMMTAVSQGAPQAGFTPNALILSCRYGFPRCFGRALTGSR